MFMIIVDGIPWADADGKTEWPEFEIDALCDVIAAAGCITMSVIETAPEPE
jgi:hypothetical protein